MEGEGGSMERLNFDAKKIQIIDIGLIDPNTWNPKDKNTEEYLKIKKGMELKGQRLPIVVRQKGDRFEIIDGEQRFTALKSLGYKRVIIYNEGQVSDKEARELTIWYQQQVPFDELKLSKLVKELNAMGEPELPFSIEEMQEYLTMADFDWQNYQGNFVDLIETDTEITLEVDKAIIPDIKKFIMNREKELEKSKGKKKMMILSSRKFKVLSAQFQIIDQALSKIKADNNINDDARALELICADFLGK